MAYSTTESRGARLTLFSSALFVLLALTLIRLQVIEGNYYRSLSQKNRLRLINLDGPRGNMWDRHGRSLAGSRLSFNVTAVLRERPSRIKKSFERLSAILGEKSSTLETRYEKKKAGAYQSIVLAEDILLPQAIAVEEQLHLMPGLMIETKPLRTYPYAEAAAHLVGFIGPQSTEENEELEFSGYGPSDWIGRDGLERSYESYVRGYSGGLQLEVNNRGDYSKVLGVKEPKEGRDLRLSVDAELQKYVHKKFSGRRGAVAVMELQNGGLLCLNSYPSYDPNLFASARGRKDVGKYLTDDLSPLLNRAIQGQYPPGSIFKIVTALASLEDGKTTIASVFNCPGFAIVGGRRFRCWREGGHGPQGLTEAYAHSCDVFFYMTGLAAGPDAIHRKAVELGYSLVTGVDLPGERAGLVPSRGWKQKKLHAGWYDGDTLNFSIGQGYLQVTPLQALGMIATIATGGEKLRPHLVEDIGGVDVATRQRSEFQVTPQFLKAVKRGLEEVVNSSSGTGRLAQIEGVKVAGKTGSAETQKDQTHAWYVGYAPSDHPKIAFVVFLEFGGHGGVEAAELSNGLLMKLKELGYL